jgi:hypothetical protein
VRTTTAFKRLLRLSGASVIDVSFGTEGVIVTVWLRRRATPMAAFQTLLGLSTLHHRRPTTRSPAEPPDPCLEPTGYALGR